MPTRTLSPTGLTLVVMSRMGILGYPSVHNISNLEFDEELEVEEKFPVRDPASIRPST